MLLLAQHGRRSFPVCTPFRYVAYATAAAGTVGTAPTNGTVRARDEDSVLCPGTMVCLLHVLVPHPFTLPRLHSILSKG